VRDEIVARYRALDLPTYWAGINPALTATLDARGHVTAVAMSYPRDPVRQYLTYASMYNPALAPAGHAGAGAAR
jgi:hypothetical protein